MKRVLGWVQNNRALAQVPLIAWICVLCVQASFGQTSVFTYQGRLLEAGQAANGHYDLKFTLFNAGSNGAVVGVPLTNTAVPVSNGLFSTSLDFGSSAFDGSPRWLELAVRTNATPAPFTVLARRQQITFAPYAAFALNAASSSVAASLNPGVALTGNGAAVTNIVGSNIVEGTLTSRQFDVATWQAVTNPATRTNDVAAIGDARYIGNQAGRGTNPVFVGTLTNTFLTLTNPWNDDFTALMMGPAINRSALWWGNNVFENGASIFWNPYHSADVGNNYYGELQISAPAVAIGIGQDSLPGSGWRFYRRLQLGIGTYHHGWVDLQYDGVGQFGDPAYSNPLRWVINQKGLEVDPAIQGVSLDTVGGLGHTALNFYDTFDTLVKNGTWNYAGSPLRAQLLAGQGWHFLGREIWDRTSAVSSSTSCALNFGSERCVDLSLYSQDISFFTTNSTGSGTNYEKVVFILRSGPFSPLLSWPSGWTVLGAASGATLPPSLAAGQLIELELESIGPGETNKLARAFVGADTTFAFDPAATNFFARAGITNPVHKGAINQLIQSARSHGWWTNCDVIYPFVGGSAASHRENLKSSSYQIAWSGTLVHDANGVTGDAATGYGNTGLNFKTAALAGAAFNTNSAHLFVYCGTAQPTDHGGFLAGYRWVQTISRAGLHRDGSSFEGAGLNDADDIMGALSSSGDFRGPLFVTRTGSNSQALGIREAFGAGVATAAVEAPNSQCVVLARIDQYGAVDHFSNANIRGATIGGGMSQAQWDVFRQDWDAFEALLNRKAP
jgi:hypothetical protein